MEKKEKPYNRRLAHIVASKIKKKLKLSITPGEIIIKSYLESAKIKFKFQHDIVCEDCFYIVDFYIPSLKTIIEVDGSQHYTEAGLKKDSIRKDKLEVQGYTKIFRIKNSEVFKMSRKKFLDKLKTYEEGA